MHCSYCNGAILLPRNMSTTEYAGDVSPSLGPLLGKAVELAKITGYLRAGENIQAIRLYREAFNVDLRTAKTAVDNLAAGKPTMVAPVAEQFSTLSPAVKVASAGLSVGCILAAAIMGFVAVILFVTFRFVHQQVAESRKAIKSAIVHVPPTPALPATPTTRFVALSPLAPPPAPQSFARMTLAFGTEGVGRGQFKDSRSVAVDGDGHIYVGEYSDGRVQVFDQAGKFLTAWKLESPKSLLNLVADRKGTVYAIVPAHIFRYEGLTGKPLGEMDTINTDVEEFYQDAAVAPNGDIYAIGGTSHIVILSSDGKIKSTIRANDKIGEAVMLEKIALLGTGEIYALDHERGIFKFAPDGRYINRFGSIRGNSPGHFLSPHGLAIDGRGYLFVSDSAPAIHVYDADGNYIDSFGANEVAFGMAVTDKNELYACFRNRNEVRKFVIDRK